jgi:hypothetical protein
MNIEKRLQIMIENLKRRGLPPPDGRPKAWRARRRSSPSPYADGVGIAMEALKEYEKDLEKIK